MTSTSCLSCFAFFIVQCNPGVWTCKSGQNSFLACVFSTIISYVFRHLNVLSEVSGRRELEDLSHLLQVDSTVHYALERHCFACAGFVNDLLFTHVEIALKRIQYHRDGIESAVAAPGLHLEHRLDRLVVTYNPVFEHL